MVHLIHLFTSDHIRIHQIFQSKDLSTFRMKTRGTCAIRMWSLMVVSLLAAVAALPITHRQIHLRLRRAQQNRRLVMDKFCANNEELATFDVLLDTDVVSWKLICDDDNVVWKTRGTVQAIDSWLSEASCISKESTCIFTVDGATDDTWYALRYGATTIAVHNQDPQVSKQEIMCFGPKCTEPALEVADEKQENNENKQSDQKKDDTKGNGNTDSNTDTEKDGSGQKDGTQKDANNHTNSKGNVNENNDDKRQKAVLIGSIVGGILGLLLLILLVVYCCKRRRRRRRSQRQQSHEVPPGSQKSMASSHKINDEESQTSQSENSVIDLTNMGTTWTSRSSYGHDDDDEEGDAASYASDRRPPQAAFEY